MYAGSHEIYGPAKFLARKFTDMAKSKYTVLMMNVVYPLSLTPPHETLVCEVLPLCYVAFFVAILRLARDEIKVAARLESVKTIGHSKRGIR